MKKTALYGILSAERDFMLLDVAFVLQIALTEVKIYEFLVKKLLMGEEWGFLFNAKMDK